MDQTIQEIATEVAKHLSGYAWVGLTLQLLLMAGAAALGALLGAFLKKTGEHLATKRHFDEIKRQLGETETIRADVARNYLAANTELVETVRAEVARSQLEANTELVEKIKAQVAQSQLEVSTKIVEAVRSEFAQRDWASRERATLRRVKIEELLEKVNECRAYLERYQQAAIDGKRLDELNPLTELRAIAKLYLPELAAETKTFSDMYEGQLHQGLLHRHKLSMLSTEEKQRELKMDYGWQVAKSKKSGEADALIEAARKLLEDTMGPQARSEGGTPQTEGTSGTNSP